MRVALDRRRASSLCDCREPNAFQSSMHKVFRTQVLFHLQITLDCSIWPAQCAPLWPCWNWPCSQLAVLELAVLTIGRSGIGRAHMDRRAHFAGPPQGPLRFWAPCRAPCRARGPLAPAALSGSVPDPSSSAATLRLLPPLPTYL